MMPWRELPHTADMMLEITAPTWPALLTEAAAALSNHLGEIDPTAPREMREVSLTALDREELLVRWLTMAIVWYETDGVLVADAVVHEASATQLTARVSVAPPGRLTGHVKAATYHDLAVVESDAGWRVRIVLDL